MKLRHAVHERRARVIGPGCGSVGACGGFWGGGSPKAPNPQASAFAWDAMARQAGETSIFNHQTGDSDAWERLSTLRYACERLADGAPVGLVGSCAEKGKHLRKLCGHVREDAAMCGYVRIFGKRGHGRLAACLFLTTIGHRKKDFGIIFTGNRVIIWEAVISLGDSPYFSRGKFSISRPFQSVGHSRTLTTA